MFRISDAAVQHRHERELETVGDDFQFTECQIAFVQLSIGDALFDEFLHELFDFLGCRFLQTARRALDHVGQAHDRAFFCLRLGPAVAKAFFLHFRNVFLAHVHDLTADTRVFLLLHRALVEIINERCAVMFLDDVDHALIEFVFERKIDALFHVSEDDQRAHCRRKIIVRIALEVHVFGEVFRLHQFADVVEIGTDTTKRGVRADLLRGRLGQVRHDQTVMVRARRLDGHATQQRMVQVGSFEPGNVRRDLKQILEKR